MVGNEVYIQRGETWSLDFSVTNKKGHPYVVLKNWRNPYLAITVSAALYEQRGDFRETYWLDLKQRYVEQSDGSMALENIKTFISGEVLWLPNGFYAADAIHLYGADSGNGKIVLDPTSDFDVTNFLFFCDPFRNGNYSYRYITKYEIAEPVLDEEGNLAVDEDGNIIDEGGYILEGQTEWAEYDFRIIKHFTTKDWMEQNYLFDVKVLAGESVQEYIAGILDTQGDSYKPFIMWTNEDWDEYIALIQDETLRTQAEELYDEGAPLMPSYDTKGLLIEPSTIHVSVNIQGGVR